MGAMVWSCETQKRVPVLQLAWARQPRGWRERRRASPCPRVAGSSGEGRCLDDRLWRQPCSTVGINTGKVGVTGIGLVLGGAFDWGQF